MKIRSLLLAACMVVVPLIAMFSHRIPPAARAAVGDWIHDLVRGTRPATAAAPLVVAPEPAPRPPAAAPGSGQAAVADDAGRSDVLPVVALAPDIVPPTTAATLERLRALGAVAIDCRAIDGPGGHVASCRVPVDDAGQLERVFQATGADPAAAADNLLRDVHAWRAGPTVGPVRTMRF